MRAGSMAAMGLSPSSFSVVMSVCNATTTYPWLARCSASDVERAMGDDESRLEDNDRARRAFHQGNGVNSTTARQRAGSGLMGLTLRRWRLPRDLARLDQHGIGSIVVSAHGALQPKRRGSAQPVERSDPENGSEPFVDVVDQDPGEAAGSLAEQRSVDQFQTEGNRNGVARQPARVGRKEDIAGDARSGHI